MTTLTLRRNGEVRARPSTAPLTTSATPDVDRPTVPDHVPPHLAEEHPDARAVVAGAGHHPPRRWVGGASHQPGRRRPIRASIGLVICASLALTAAIRDEPQGQPLTRTDVRVDTSPAPVSPVAQCAGATADPRQNPFAQLAPVACNPGTAIEPVLWDLVEIARDLGIGT